MIIVLKDKETVYMYMVSANIKR